MLRTLRLALLAAALPVAPALAADLDPIYAEDAPEYVPVEVGSGWYLRGDVAYHVNDDAFGGDDLDGDYARGGFRTDTSEDRFSGSLGIGYHFTDYLRGDVNAGYIPGSEIEIGFGDDANGIDGHAENEAWYGMANLYVDLGTVAGFTPYVGAGAGFLSNKREHEVRFEFDGDRWGSGDEERDTAFAYTLNAGLAYRFTENLSVDLGYQFFSSPDAEYVDVADPESYPVRDGLDFHQVRLGLRYDLW